MPLARATGDAVRPSTAADRHAGGNGKPTITMPRGAAAPTALVVQPLIKGNGPVVEAGQTMDVQYTGAIWDTGKVFDSSWDRGQPLETRSATARSSPAGTKASWARPSARRCCSWCRPTRATARPAPARRIKGTDTLVFVVDILDAY